MSFKSIFFKEDPEEEKRKEEQEVAKAAQKPKAEPKQPEATVAQSAQAAPTAQTASAANVQTARTTDEVNNDGLRQLWQVLNERNLPGPDMLELKNFAASLESTGLPLEKRYEAAFLMLKSQYPDFTKVTLLNSIDTYIKFINEEHQNGKGQFEQKKNLLINDKTLKVEKLKEESQKILEQIEQLKARHEQAQTDIIKLQEEIGEATASIAHEEEVFNNTFSHFIEALEKDKALMSNLNIQ